MISIVMAARFLLSWQHNIYCHGSTWYLLSWQHLLSIVMAALVIYCHGSTWYLLSWQHLISIVMVALHVFWPDTWQQMSWRWMATIVIKTLHIHCHGNKTPTIVLTHQFLPWLHFSYIMATYDMSGHGHTWQLSQPHRIIAYMYEGHSPLTTIPWHQLPTWRKDWNKTNPWSLNRQAMSNHFFFSNSFNWCHLGRN